METSDKNELYKKISELEKELRILRSLNRSMNMVVENSPTAIVITDNKGYIEYVNPTFTNITGYTEEESIGMHTRTLKSGMHPPEYYDAMWKTLANGKIWKDIFYNKKKDGSYYWEQQYIGPIKDDNGTITHYVSIKIDITLQKEFEQKLKANQEYLNAITIALPEILFIIDATGHFVDVIAPPDNALYQEIAGFKECSIYDKLPEDLADKFQELINTTTEKKEAQLIEFELFTGMGPKWFEGRSAPLGLMFGNYSAIVFVAYDITERKLSQQALKESEARFRSIFESANTGIVFTDSIGKIIFTNKTFENILGYSSIELSNKLIREISHEEDIEHENTHVAEILMGVKNNFRIEKRFIKSNGNIVWVDLSLAAIRNEQNEATFLVSMVNDISERVFAEKRLKQLIATKDKFFSIIAHDLKNPFNALLGLSELLYSNNEEYNLEQTKELGKLMNESSRNAYELLENLLQWSRSQTGQLVFNLQAHNLKELVEQSIKVTETQAYNKKISLNNLITPDIIVQADGQLLKTVLRNLVSNAVKFTKPGGFVNIDARKNGQYLYLIIEDSGVGMSEEALKQLFQIEYKYSTLGTRNEKGTGLGLILCKEFIEMHKGQIKVESTEGKGTTFFISLPLYY